MTEKQVISDIVETANQIRPIEPADPTKHALRMATEENCREMVKAARRRVQVKVA